MNILNRLPSDLKREVYRHKFNEVILELKYCSEIWTYDDRPDKASIHIKWARRAYGCLSPLYTIFDGEVQKKGYIDNKYIHDDRLWDDMLHKYPHFSCIDRADFTIDLE